MTSTIFGINAHAARYAGSPFLLNRLPIAGAMGNMYDRQLRWLVAEKIVETPGPSKTKTTTAAPWGSIFSRSHLVLYCQYLFYVYNYVVL